MKRIIVCSLLPLLFTHPKVSAQDTKAQQPVKTGNEWKMPSDVLQRSKKFSADLQRKLGLDSIQTRKAYALFLANTKPLDEISVASVSEKEKALMIKNNQLAFNAKLQEILTPAQYQNYLAIPKR